MNHRTLVRGGALLLVLIVLATGCGNVVTTSIPTTGEPLSVQIDSPEDGDELSVNVQKVSGVVSDPEAAVQVNGVDVGVNQNGDFYAYVEFNEGENTIEVITTRGNDTYSDSITVTLTPALAVYLDFLVGEQGVDYTNTPVTVTGWVSNDEATVNVNGNRAQVAEDGNFSVNVQLEVGSNRVEAVATLDGRRDTWGWPYAINPDGAFGPPATGPAFQNAPLRTFNDHDIQLKAGDTKLLNATMNIGKRHYRSISDIFYYELYGYAAVSGSEKIPIPEGLKISLEPSGFILFPNTTYQLVITITAAPDLFAIPHYISFKLHFGDESSGGIGIITVNVEE